MLLLTGIQPGHEYTKANVKFGVSVLQNEAIKKLQSYADNNKETQGKFTIGDEKEHNVFMRVEVGSCLHGSIQRQKLICRIGSCDTESHRRD